MALRSGVALFCRLQGLLVLLSSPFLHGAVQSNASSEAPPQLAWERVGYSVDHRVGSPPASHFGLLVRNAGGGELQAALFVSSSQARFYLARPRDLVLRGGQEVRCSALDLSVRSYSLPCQRIVDIKCPLYLLESSSMFRDNATLSLHSNGGTASLLLAPEQFPEPQHGLRVHQRGNGVHSWSREPSYAAVRYHVAAFISFALLVSLWALARAARMHVHASGRRKPPALGRGGRDVAEAEEAEEAAAVQAVQAYEAQARRAAEKAAALEAWVEEEREAASEERMGDEAVGGGGAGAAGAGAALCCICLLRPRDTAILPCRHVAVCCACVRRLTAPGCDGAACPICRGPLDSWLELYLS